MTLVLKRGDYVRVRCRGDTEWTQCLVTLSSPNHKSLIVMFNGAIRAGNGFLMAVLPLSYEPDTDRFVGVVSLDEYEVELNANDPPEPNL